MIRAGALLAGLLLPAAALDHGVVLPDRQEHRAPRRRAER